MDPISFEEFAVTRSGLPSPFRSPIATEGIGGRRQVFARGLEAAVAPVEEHGDGVPLAVHRRQVRLPSPFRSPIATELELRPPP